MVGQKQSAGLATVSGISEARSAVFILSSPALLDRLKGVAGLSVCVQDLEAVYIANELNAHCAIKADIQA